MKVNKIIELVALGVGGLSLFIASFLVFALSAGIPAHQVAIVGGLFPEPAPTETGVSGETIAGATPDVVEKTIDEVLMSSIGNLPNLDTQSIFSDSELAEVVNELKRVKADFQEGVANVERREAEVETRAENLEERARVLNDYMATLDRREFEIGLLQEELDAGITIRDDKHDVRWAKIAKAFEGTEDLPKLASRLLIYKADEAALILKNLDADQRNLILDALPDADTFREYNDAYSALES